MRLTDLEYMKLALEQARVVLRHDRLPVGAVFVDESGHIAARGLKNGVTHPRFDHAEHNAIYQLLWDPKGLKNLEGFTVYSTLEPCIMCMSLLMTTRVSRVVYGFPDAYGGGEFLLKSSSLSPRFQAKKPISQGGVLAEESQRLLRAFFSTQKADTFWANRSNPLVKAVMTG